MPETVIVTGAAGFAGSHLLDTLVVDCNVAAVRPDVIYHCAGAPHVGLSWNDAASALAVNVRGTHNLLEGVRRHRVDARVFICGSAMVYQTANEALTESHPLIP